MKHISLLGLLALSTLSQAAHVRRDYAENDYYVIQLEQGVDPDLIAERFGLEHHGHLGDMTQHHVFRTAKTDDDHVHTIMTEHRRRRKRGLSSGRDLLDGVLLAEKQKRRLRNLHKRIIPPVPAALIRERQLHEEQARSVHSQTVDWAVKKRDAVMKDLDIKDPIFKEQWHLFNTVETGHDVNVTDVWRDGVTGQNVTIAIVDDGLDMDSNDLRDNYFAEGSYDFNDHDPSPKPELSDDKHGTRCAGEVSAVRNDACGLGVAYDSKIAGIRILSGELTNADEAEALIYKSQHNNIYSCSWGPPDDGRHMEAPSTLIRQAILQGVQQGRGGKGSVYVFASGNGASSGDNCNFDGYTNSIYSITVGAVDRAGQHPYYSEMCSANLVVTYSSGSGDSIHTTDVGTNTCYSGHGGTSAAAPLAAGIFALALQVRPELTWRDLQYVALHSAAHVDSADDWQETSIGKQFSHTFGYGKVDSYALVNLAREWELVKPQAWYFSPWQHVKKAIPEGEGDDAKGLEVEFEVTKDMLKEANLERLEHVTVTMNVEHTRRGDISVDLVSPHNVVSHIATARMYDEEAAGYDDWTFMTVAHWGESGVGKWKLIIKDNKENEHQGTFVDWHLKLWGESIDASKATLLPMPQDSDDDNHDQDEAEQPPVSTATVPTQPEPTQGKPTPTETEHTQRPTKPASGGDETKPQPTATEEEDETASASTSAVATPSPSSSWISWLPTLGASSAARPWVYAAIGLIGAFCIGLGVYFWMVRRRRLLNDSTDTYAFDVLNNEEGEGLNGGEKTFASGGGAGGAAGRSRRTRGGELYDAFAAASEDEDEDDDFDRYTDREAGLRNKLPGERDREQYEIGEDSDEDEDETRRLR
ncbi:kexin [Geosmithia morbida]|uniref:Kexin n=1 Tax=Geosmithia morbida TaxID=1094350 RepID=A0A9P5D7S8_9HYPO|nr:kexin [Geosmithia morbida]KAF4124819.1 kexin [Geosmithia morbida]